MCTCSKNYFTWESVIGCDEIVKDVSKVFWLITFNQVLASLTVLELTFTASKILYSRNFVAVNTCKYTTSIGTFNYNFIRFYIVKILCVSTW